MYSISIDDVPKRFKTNITFFIFWNDRQFWKSFGMTEKPHFCGRQESFHVGTVVTRNCFEELLQRKEYQYFGINLGRLVNVCGRVLHAEIIKQSNSSTDLQAKTFRLTMKLTQEQYLTS